MTETERIPPPFLASTESGLPSETGENLPSKRRMGALGRKIFLLIGLFCVLGFNGLAQEKPTEYQVKAAFLFNFAKFVEWPPQAFADASSPIVIGVLGKNVFGNDLEKTIRDKKVNNRSFQFKNLTSAAEATNCHILFVSSSEKDNLAKIVESLHGASVLTVADTDGFIKAGGMINFLFQGVNIRFEISDDAAKKARLQVSSKLLSLSVHSQ